MRLRWVLLSAFSILVAVFAYGVFTAPSKLTQVEFVVVEKSGPWKADISQYVLSYVHVGQDLTPEFLSNLKEEIEALPWVKKCKLEVNGGKLTVEIWETRPKFVLISDRETFLIGENGFVLKKGVGRKEAYPVFFYRGKTSPFTVVNGFLMLKKSVKMELKLLNSKISEIELEGKKPEISLLDSGVQLAFKSPPVLIYLGIGGDAWDRFSEISKKGFLKPGVYDFRFEQMMVIKGRQEKCSGKNS